MNGWKTQHGFVIGKSHESSATPCQDYASSFEDDTFNISVLSDGCGSSSHSDIGSKLVVQSTIKMIVEKFDEIISNDPVESRLSILNYINKALLEKASELEVDIKELNATLLFVAIKNNDQLLLGHLGDGFIGAVKNTKLEIKSLEKKEDEVNGTVYTTTENAHVHFDLRKGSIKDYQGFILMSDGSGEALVDSRIAFEKKFINSVAGILEFVGSKEIDQSQKMITDYLEKIKSHIQSGDDCSLSILVKDNIKISQIETYHVPKPEIKDPKLNTFDFDIKNLPIIDYINEKLKMIHWKPIDKKRFEKKTVQIDPNNEDDKRTIMYIKHLDYNRFHDEN